MKCQTFPGVLVHFACFNLTNERVTAHVKHGCCLQSALQENHCQAWSSTLWSQVELHFFMPVMCLYYWKHEDSPFTQLLISWSCMSNLLFFYSFISCNKTKHFKIKYFKENNWMKKKPQVVVKTYFISHFSSYQYNRKSVQISNHLQQKIHF